MVKILLLSSLAAAISMFITRSLARKDFLQLAMPLLLISLLGWLLAGMPEPTVTELIIVVLNFLIFESLTHIKWRLQQFISREQAAKAYLGATLGLLGIVWFSTGR